jgi:hypothetical protein
MFLLGFARGQWLRELTAVRVGILGSSSREPKLNLYEAV